jgi:hypothetical protein
VALLQAWLLLPSLVLPSLPLALLLPSLELLLGFFWLLPSSSLLNEQWEIAIVRFAPAYIGGDFPLMQVFFEIFWPNALVFKASVTLV